jgi:hypothetical protein
MRVTQCKQVQDKLQKTSSIYAGLPNTVACTTVNKSMCLRHESCYDGRKDPS